MIMGSVAASDTTSNDTMTLQTNSDNVVETTSSYTNTQNTTTQDYTNTIDDSTDTITKTSNTNSSTKTSASSSTTANSTSTVQQSSTIIKVYNITTTRNSTVTFKSLVTKSDGSYVKNGTVVFKINGKTIGNATVSNGGAKLTYTIPSSWTNINYTITAVYTGNDNYARSTSTNSTLKLKSNLTTQVKVSDVTALQAETITIKTVITTSDGTYVKTGKVAFKINGKTIGTANVSNGGAKITYTIPDSWKSTNYNITVVYGQNDYYKNSTGSGILKIESKTTPKITINSTSAVSGQSATLITTLTDGSGNLVNGGKVAFKLNGKTIGTANVTKGVAKLTYSMPSGWNGNYNITIVYGGYGKYNSATKTTTIKVEKPVSSKITLDTTYATSGKSTVITATITDGSGNKVTGGKVAFKLNGKTIGTANVTNGVAKLTYTMPSGWNGKYNITIVYGGYGKYLSTRKTTTITVTPKGSVPSGYENYVKATTNCQVNNTKIKSIVSSLSSGLTSTYSIAVKLFNYVRDSVSYSSYYNTRYGAVGTLNAKTGNCVDQTHLLIAMMRTADIPARYCHATCTFRSGLVVGHVWAEVYVNGKWYKCDTTSRSNSFGSIQNWYSSTSVSRYISLSF